MALKRRVIPLKKRAKGLYEKLISEENLRNAIDEVNRTHHWKAGHKPNRCTAWVEETKETRLRQLRDIIEGGFVPGPGRTMEKYDSSARKVRVIHEPAQWPDQYVHHALVQVLQPVMMRGMDHWCCGSIRGRGTHYAKRAIEGWMAGDRRGTRYCLCADIRHFYDSLRPGVVMDRMRRLVKDRRLLDLVERVTGDGIRIGAYPSQWFANTTLQPLDVLIRQSGLCRHYVRYMDNLTVFGASKRNLHRLRRLISKWLSGHGLELKGDWQVFPAAYSHGAGPGRMPDAVGYRYGRGYTLPRKHNLIRIKRAIARYRKKRGGGRSPRKMAHGLLSRLGQIRHCNNCRLYKRLYGGERIERELKKIIERKGVLTWSTYLAQREMLKLCGPKATASPA